MDISQSCTWLPISTSPRLPLEVTVALQAPYLVLQYYGHLASLYYTSSFSCFYPFEFALGSHWAYRLVSASQFPIPLTSHRPTTFQTLSLPRIRLFPLRSVKPHHVERRTAAEASRSPPVLERQRKGGTRPYRPYPDPSVRL